MRKVLFFVLVTVLMSATLFAVNTPVKMQEVKSSKFRVLPASRDSEIIFSEDFEGELTWTTSEDAPAPNESWHIVADAGFEGACWWMQDPAIDGYTNERYLVMDSDSFVVPADGELTFKALYSMEGIGGTGEYNGWDGFNVRIKVGDGDWTVLENPTPAYSADSFYSFGNIWGEGPGVPAWGGTVADWTDYSFDLAAYAGESVQIRFAFASDGAMCTNDDDGDPSFFGVKIDNVAVGSAFAATGDSEDEFDATHFVNESYWELSAGEGMDGSQALKNPIGNERIDRVISPVISIPGNGIALLEYDVNMDMPDYDGDQDAEGILDDYYMVHVSPVDSDEWTQLHYLWANPETIVSPGVWQHVNQAWLEGILNPTVGTFCDLSDFAGQDVQVSFLMRTDNNNDGGEGTGLYLDNVEVWFEGFQPVPTNLTATAGNEEIELAWDAPMTYENEDLIYTNSSFAAVLGDAVPTAVLVENTFTEAVKVSSSNFALYTFDESETITGSVDVVIWENANGLPGSVIGSVTGFEGMEQMTEYKANVEELDVWIQPGESVFVGIQNYDVAGGNQGVLYETSANTGHTFVNVEGTWQSAEVYQTTDGDLFTNSSLGATVLMPSADAVTPDSYIVYRRMGVSDYEEIGTATTNNYTDASPVLNAMNTYVVTAVYSGTESLQSNEASTFVYSASVGELSQDDGTMETTITPGFNEYVLVKFNDDQDASASLMQVKYYVDSFTPAVSIVCSGFEADENGMPSEDSAFSILVNNQTIQQGWNILDIGADNSEDFNLENGFFLGFRTLQAATFGVDTDNAGMSYTSEDGEEWEAYGDGSIMIRAIVENATSEEEELVSAASLNIANYPNPFNPVTTIKFNMAKAGKANVSVYNVKGQLVKTLANDNFAEGTQTVIWNGSDNNNNSVSSGVYFYKVSTEKESKIGKMVLMK